MLGFRIRMEVGRMGVEMRERRDDRLKADVFFEMTRVIVKSI